MLFFFSYIIFYSHSVNSAVVDLDCTVNGMYTPQAVNCKNNLSDSECIAEFEAYYALDVGSIGDRPVLCVLKKEMAIAKCPRACGYCCKTDQFSCANVQKTRINCDNVEIKMCYDPKWREIIAEDCPASCGFCLDEGCVDALPDCALYPSICYKEELHQFVVDHCKKTCKLC